MKKIFKSFAIVAAAAATLSACNKSEQAPVADDTIQIVAVASTDEAKTTFNQSGSTYGITWNTEKEEVKLTEIRGSENTDLNSTGYTLSDGGKKANFKFSVPVKSAENYDYYAIYPKSAWSKTTVGYKDFSVVIPTNQTPSATSVDPAATVLFAQDAGHSTQPGKLNLGFKHFAAYGKVTIKNLPLDDDEVVQNISLSAEGRDLSGTTFLYWETMKYGHTSGNKNNILIDTKNLNTTGDFTAMFACVPDTLEINDILKVSVTTNKDVKIREITLAKAMEFASGKVMNFSVDMSKIIPPVDYSGTYVVLAKSSSKYYALSAEANGSRLWAREFSYNGTDTEIELTDDNLIWNVVKNGTAYYFKNGSKYLHWDSSGNYADMSSSAYELLINNVAAGYNIVSKADQSRILAKNSSNSYFAFYTGSGEKNLLLISAKKDTKPVISPISNPNKVASEGDVVTVSYSITNPVQGVSVSASSAESWVNTFDYSVAGEISFAVDANTTSSDRSSVVTVSYTGAQSVQFTVTQSAKGTVSYSIVFKTNPDSVDGTQMATSTSLSNIISSGTNYVSKITECSKANYQSVSGVKLGSSSAIGSFGISIKNDYQTGIKSIKLVSAKYKDNEGELEIYINGASKATASNITQGEDYTLTFDEATTVSSIVVKTTSKSSKRAYIKEIVLNK